MCRGLPNIFFHSHFNDHDNDITIPNFHLARGSELFAGFTSVYAGAELLGPALDTHDIHNFLAHPFPVNANTPEHLHRSYAVFGIYVHPLTSLGILVITTTVDRHHFVEVAPVTVTTIEKVTETKSEMQRVTETQTQKITEIKMVTITASGGTEQVTETKMVTVIESGATGTEEAVGSTIILLPLPSSSITETGTTMTTIAIITTDVTLVVTAILTPSTTEVIDATTTEHTTAPGLTSSAQPAPMPITTEATIVEPTSTAEPAPVITATPEPTSEIDSGLRSSTLLRISISRLSPPPAPAFETAVPTATETLIVTLPLAVAGDDDSETPSNLPDWDDVKGFASTFAGP
ncbi:hypothetical protein DFP73DRAFT_582006 [Morchella snyderi]|nr:hypothetical protein DFP73DRAFT_582006 [Morchella snyderi]